MYFCINMEYKIIYVFKKKKSKNRLIKMSKQFNKWLNLA